VIDSAGQKLAYVYFEDADRHASQHRWKGRRGLSPFGCCAMVV
jgi:hypothetical protein